MRYAKYIPWAFGFFVAFSGPPVWSAQPCGQLLEDRQHKRQEILVVEAAIRLQQWFELVQLALDGLHEIAVSPAEDTTATAEKLEELLEHTRGAHEQAEELVRRVRQSLKTAPGKPPQGGKAIKKVRAAGRYLENIVAARTARPSERLRRFGDYSRDLRGALSPFLKQAPVLATALRLYSQAIDSAADIAWRLEGAGAEKDQLLREFGPYGSYALYPRDLTMRQQLAAHRRGLYREVQELARRREASCEDGPEKSAEEEQFDRARDQARGACDGEEAEQARQDAQEALLRNRAAMLEHRAAEKGFKDARAGFRKHFAPDLELRKIEKNLARYQLGIERRLGLIEQIDRQIGNLRRQEETEGTRSFIKDRRAQQEREVKKIDRVRREISRQERLRERRILLRNKAIETMRAAATGLQNALQRAADTQAAATRAECAMDRCARTRLLGELPALGIDLETAGTYFPVLLDAGCEDL